MNEEKQTVETVETTDQVGGTRVDRQTVSQNTEVSGRVLLNRVVWFIVGFISVFLAARVVLMLLAANQGNAFVDFVYAVGGIFAAPFFGIFGYEPAYGNSVFEISSVVAILVYVLIGWGITKLINLGSPTGTVE